MPQLHNLDQNTARLLRHTVLCPFFVPLILKPEA